MAGQLQCRGQQRRRVHIVADEGSEQAHLLLHQRTLVAMGKHRVEVDDLRRLAQPLRHQLDGIALEQGHPRGDSTHLGVPSRATQTILQQRGNQRLAFDQAHFTAQRRQHKGIAPEPRCSIQHPWPDTGLDAHGLGDHLPTATTELTPVRCGPLDEIHPYRPRCLRLEQLKLQAVRANLQSEFGRVLNFRQVETLRPLMGGSGELRSQRFDSNHRVACGHWASSGDGKPRIVPEHSRLRASVQRHMPKPPMST